MEKMTNVLDRVVVQKIRNQTLISQVSNSLLLKKRKPGKKRKTRQPQMIFQKLDARCLISLETSQSLTLATLSTQSSLNHLSHPYAMQLQQILLPFVLMIFKHMHFLHPIVFSQYKEVKHMVVKHMDNKHNTIVSLLT